MHSKIQITVGKYIEPRHPILVSELTGETAFKPLIFAINALKEFINHYKVSTDDYWIPRVTHKMLTSFRCEILSNSVKVFSSPYSGMEFTLHILKHLSFQKLNNQSLLNI
jgi:hypothetical protein